MNDSTANERSVPPHAHGLLQAERHMRYARHTVEGALGRFGVTWCGYLLLSAAARRDNMTYRELISEAGLAASTVPVLVNAMCQEELLTCSAESSRQGGRVLVTMTDQGRHHLEAIHRRVEPVAEPLLVTLVDLLHVDGASQVR